MEEHCTWKRWSQGGGVLWLVVLFITAVPAWAAEETVKLPMTFDFALLRELIVKQAYPRGGRVEIANMSGGCNEIWLANPRLSEEKGAVRFQTDIDISWGTPVADTCVAPFNWSGAIVLWQQPKVDSLWRLHFATKNSVLLNQSGEEAVIPSIIWELVKKNVHTYIDSIAMNLAPPVDNLKQFMVPQATNEQLAAAERFLATMRPEQPLVESYGLLINILAEADIPPETGQDEGVPAVPDPEMQAQVLALWQAWDALLVNMIGQLSAKELTVEDRQLLLDTLLTVRYEFSEVLGGPELTTGFVRGQFINSWVSLKPLFKRHLTPRPADSMLGYLSFFTAADALVTLDRLGPLLGIDISREGFYRLAHMLSDRELNESGEVDVHLREILGMGPPMAVPALPEAVAQPEAPPEPGIDRPQEERPGGRPPAEGGENPAGAGSGVFNWLLWQRLFSPTEAYGADEPLSDEVRSWTAGLTSVESLLPRTLELLARAAGEQQRQLDGKLAADGWGERMVKATAWQESCFRQFVVKGEQITYLLSYNNSSVGIMQVNEKVWRGIYDRRELRWNIEYNSMAGSEILAVYLNRYLAKHKDPAGFGDQDGRRYVATWLYSLYNGGPGQLKKFPKRQAAGRLNKFEMSFQEKYDKVAGERWQGPVDCLPST